MILHLKKTPRDQLECHLMVDCDGLKIFLSLRRLKALHPSDSNVIMYAQIMKTVGAFLLQQNVVQLYELKNSISRLEK